MNFYIPSDVDYDELLPYYLKSKRMVSGCKIVSSGISFDGTKRLKNRIDRLKAISMLKIAISMNTNEMKEKLAPLFSLPLTEEEKSPVMPGMTAYQQMYKISRNVSPEYALRKAIDNAIKEGLDFTILKDLSKSITKTRLTTQAKQRKNKKRNARRKHKTKNKNIL